MTRSIEEVLADPTLAPYRGAFGATRPAALAHLPLPGDPMPSRHRTRPLKVWRYVGVFGEDLMLCLGRVRIGRARQSFWALWDRTEQRLHERTRIGAGAVLLDTGRAGVVDGSVQIDMTLEETGGVETVCSAGRSYAWTRKQGDVRVRGRALIEGIPRTIEARAVIDDTAAYYPRHTHWRWSAGVGRVPDGRRVAWSLVSGVNDPPEGSERSVWIDGEAREVPPCSFDPHLEGVDGLRFRAEAVRERHDNLLLIRSTYRQPFGTFEGELPGGLALAEGYGVMEEHDAWW